MPVPFRLLPIILLAAMLTPFLAGCGSTGLAPGLVARMDVAGAELDTETALGLINQLRLSADTPALERDPDLETAAQDAARAYAADNRPPKKPDGIGVLLLSAGYPTFAETFSGWRGARANVKALTDTDMRRAGLAVSANMNSESGTYWVLLLAP
jgi:uncharacterized protein YkwD